ncbi:MAG: prephenate dehydratase [Lachnospiraceae bacterium]|jgi:chorismate mutase/prephenate dehydratase|nr:prephenate dehydratase [Lachnospiraceae bacterium]
MRNLPELRTQLDKIDAAIVSLYRDRMALCEEVGEWKKERGNAVFDPVRENEKLDCVEALLPDAFLKKGIREIYLELMRQSRLRQYQIIGGDVLPDFGFEMIDDIKRSGVTACYQGIPGAYSEEALSSFFDNVSVVRAKTFRETCERLKTGEADYAVLPIENSTAGTVTQVPDLLSEYSLVIVGEYVLPIRHVLASIESSNDFNIGTINTVFSHPQALMQCEKYLSAHGWRQISLENTAVAAAKVAADNDNALAAICSPFAAKIYGLKVLDENISDNADNSTRFAIVSRIKEFRSQAHKISISFEVPHESGSLYRLLSHLIYNDLNMTKIESRPIKGENWQYSFLVDFEGNLNDRPVIDALKGLESESRKFQILGNY